MMRRAINVSVGWLLLFCQHVFAVGKTDTDFSVTTSNLSTWNQSEWSLTTNSYIPGQYQSRMSLANGYVGASLAAAGPFFETDFNQTDRNGMQPVNGWPLFTPRISFSTISGFYDVQENGTGTNYPWLNQYGWETFIAGIPHPTAIIFGFNDQYLDSSVSNKSISDFSSSINFKMGVGKWEYTWSPSGSATFQVSFVIFFSRIRPNVIAVQGSITPSRDIKGTVTDFLDGGSAVRAYSAGKALEDESTIWSAVHPDGLANVTAYVASTASFDNGFTNISSRAASSISVLRNETSFGQTFDIDLQAGMAATFTKYVGVASTDKFPDAGTKAIRASKDAQKDGWEVLLSEHSTAWGEIMTESSLDNFTDPLTGQLPEERFVKILQISSVVNTFYILQNLLPDGSGLNDGSVSVGGLASDSYGGLIFWDADYWMAPGINIGFPSYARQFSNYRLKLHPQAQANAKLNGYPDGSSLYPWTSGRFGNCTGVGPCVDYEYHLNYDIAFNLLQDRNVTNNQSWFDNGPRQVLETTALMTGELFDFNETTQTYWIHNMTDPDEWAAGKDNGVFTMAAAADLLQIMNQLRVQMGLPINTTWATQSENIEFPRAPSNITLEYTGFNSSLEVKQADAILLSYPLNFEQQNYDAEHKLLDLDYHSNRQSQTGPAMTYSAIAIVANAMSPSGCASFTDTMHGVETYLRAPWYQFSEQAVDNYIDDKGGPAFPFLTGHGGANQIVPYGYLGLRTDESVLYLNPSLPPQIPQVRIRDIYYAGAGISVFMNTTHTTLRRFSTASIQGLTDKYGNQPMPFKVCQPGMKDCPEYKIRIGDIVTVPNRLYFQNLTVAGNLIQCLPVHSDSNYVAGQFSTAAIDGASATRWQPLTNESASLYVNMSTVPYQPIRGLSFNWATRPPTKVSVFFGNSTAVRSGRWDPEAREKEYVVRLNNINISVPYAQVAADEGGVKPYVGNTTSVAVVTQEGKLWTGNYVRLVVEGCVQKDGQGASVAEFIILGEDGRVQ